MTPASAFWTPKREERLLALLAESQTFTQIATALRTTKGTVAGRVRKLKEAGLIETMPKAASAPQKPAQRPTRPAAPVVAPEAISAAPAAVVEPALVEPQADTRVSIDELCFPISQCRWIDGEPTADALYCGAKVLRAGVSYCPEHHARLWRHRAQRAA